MPGRLLKEVSAYEKEADAQEAKWSQMKEQGKDQYELKQQVCASSLHYLGRRRESMLAYSRTTCRL